MYTVNELFLPEMFTSLTDPESHIMFSSRSTMDQVIAVIHFRDDVSYNMHAMAIIIILSQIIIINHRVLELNLLHISLI